MKRCFKCGESKPLAAFYTHPRMADGHLNKCKECAKKDAMNHYHSLTEKRIVSPEKRLAYYLTRKDKPGRKEVVRKARARSRARYPEKTKAQTAASNAIRDGRLIPMPCEICGSANKVQGHHDDYSKPLEVRWLCFKHHLAVHGKQSLGGNT